MKKKEPASETSKIRVHLIHTNKYTPKEFKELKTLLSSEKGPIEFKYHVIDSDILEIEKWKILFSVCVDFRADAGINKSDFVIFLTTTKNEKNWFSGFEVDKKNGFIYCLDWEVFTKFSAFVIGYGVISILLQISMGLNLRIEKNNPYLHDEPIGCMNDLCQKKTQVMLKLRTGYICPKCLKKLIEKGVNFETLIYSLKIFENVRAQLLEKEEIFIAARIWFDRNDKLLKIEKGDSERVTELELKPLIRSVYLFFLRQSKEIRFDDMPNFEEELLDIYQKIGGRDKNDDFTKSINTIVNCWETFDNYRSKIHGELNRKLGAASLLYKIAGSRKQPLEIHLPLKYRKET